MVAANTNHKRMATNRNQLCQCFNHRVVVVVVVVLVEVRTAGSVSSMWMWRWMCVWLWLCFNHCWCVIVGVVLVVIYYHGLLHCRCDCGAHCYCSNIKPIGSYTYASLLPQFFPFGNRTPHSTYLEPLTHVHKRTLWPGVTNKRNNHSNCLEFNRFSSELSMCQIS